MNEQTPNPTPPAEEVPTRKITPEVAASSSISEAGQPGETRDYLPGGRLRVVPRSAPSAVPQSFGRYVVVGTLGHGAFGDVYKGHDTQLDRAVRQ